MEKGWKKQALILRSLLKLVFANIILCGSVSVIRPVSSFDSGFVEQAPLQPTDGTLTFQSFPLKMQEILVFAEMEN